MKKRLDLILFENGFFETKNAAASAILAGDVKIGGTSALKAGALYNPDILFKPPFEVEIKKAPYVSRGGFKLKKALDEFKIDLKDKICIDLGASTGGFTDCMLQAGAKKVWAVDVGCNQLAWKLKQDKRVVSVEKTNVKTCLFEDIFKVKTLPRDEMPEFMSMDLSFISIKKVLQNILPFVKTGALMVFLIKPQFEAERNEIQKGGVVRDEKIHKRIIEEIKTFAKSMDLITIGVVKSPIQGAKQGNIEYLICLKKGENGAYYS
ncbi:MAG: TlyA family RNA methyltransferase [Candidatus Gastranaerophilales bacterium]|nr:TlyA family RNA methyltransferase [Candidatus Gastranaerophilales bacterium]